MQDDRERRAALLGGLVAALDPAGRAIENHLWHRSFAFCWKPAMRAGQSGVETPPKSPVALDGPVAGTLHQSA
jgi:hypothetical protein